MNYVCNVCGYVYYEFAGEPSKDISPGTEWDSVPDEFLCPLCKADKEQFLKE